MNFSTKILICIAGVLGNASIWGDASIDTVLAHTYGYSSNKISDSKNCARLCKFGQKPRRCAFDFMINEEFIGNRTYLGINGQTPGPHMQVCLNDIVMINIVNKLQGGEIAFHWRGISNKGSPFMDGVPMVTQCPITSGTSFKYAFRADEVGTHFYHAHEVSQQLDGLFGTFVVKQPLPLEHASSLYDHDRSTEDLLLISAGNVGFRSSKIDRLLLNGLDGNASNVKRSSVVAGSRYRMRVINAIPLDCPVIVNIQNHQLIIISTDGRAVKPVSAESIILYPGERMDFILSANQIPSTYKLQINGLSHCDGLHQNSLVVYESSNVTDSGLNNIHHLMVDLNIPISGQQLHGYTSPPADLTVSPISEESLYLKVDVNPIQIEDDDNEYRYLSDAMPVPSFYPVELTMQGKIANVAQINGKTFLYPNSPILSQPNDVLKRTICNVGYEYKSKYFECVQILNVDYKSTLELIIVDEGFGSNSSKTFHMHGNPVYVLTTSLSHKKAITTEEVQYLDSLGKIYRNLLNPPRKDTFNVPNKGYTIVRIVADNPGAWLLECRGCSASSLPTAIIIAVNPRLPEKVKATLPKCGNFKRPDTLLN